MPRAKIDIPVKVKYVLITGCDTSYSRATAIKLDKMEACVLATCLTEEGEPSLQSEAIDKINDPAGLWGRVNNAGFLCSSPIEWSPLEDLERSADVSILGILIIDVTKTFLSLIKKSKGQVVNLVSMAGRVSCPFYGSYSDQI